MAITHNQTQVQWSGSNTKTVSSSTLAWSDAVAFDATDVAAMLSVKADNQGTPASGDTCAVYIAFTTGDISGSGGSDTYDSDEFAQLLFTLDTYATNTPGEDPCQKSVSIPVSAKGFKVGVSCPQAGTRNIVVSARLGTVRAA